MSTEKCFCKDKQSIVIDRRSASRVTSCVALAAFFIFATGYFIGKRHTIQDDLTGQEHALFANRIAYAIDEQCAAAQMPEDAQGAQEEPVPVYADTTIVPLPPEAITDTVPIITAEMPRHQEQESHYVALLAGYGTYRAAQQFVQKLEKKGIKAEVKTRVSTSSGKKTRTWYQVTTQKYENRETLSLLVEQLKDQEHLGSDVRILEVIKV